MSDMRYVLSLLLAALLCVGLWLAVPYNNFVLNNSFISDSYLPELVVLCMVVIVLGVNPLLRRFAPGNALEQRHLALICGVMLFAAVLPGNGLMRFMPHTLGVVTEKINQSPSLAPAVEESGLPPSLFPDPIGYDEPTPVSRQLVDQLDRDASVPWSAWVAPTLAWGTLLVAFWVLMVGLGLMVFPQWMYVERLAFPLLKVYHALLGTPETGQALPPVFRNKLFWVGFGVVFLIHSMNGLHQVTNDGFPGFPVSWNISHVLTESFWRNTPGFLKNARVYFLFVGLAYFIPNRYSFSIWFTLLFFGILIMFSQTYVPGFEYGVIYDQGAGAIIAIALGVIWLGRHHYRNVLLATLGVDRGEADHKSNALAGRMFVGGAVVMFAWFIWAGAGVFWAAVFLVSAVVIMLVVSRIVAETGLTYVWIIPLTAERVVGLLPSKWLTVASAFLQEIHYLVVNRASAVSATMITVLALGLSPRASPASQRRMAGLGIVVLVVGLLVCGAIHLDMGYRFAESLDGANAPITGRGANLVDLSSVSSVISRRETGFDLEQGGYILWGLGLSAVLLYLCGRFPAWPLHPIGLIFVYSSIGMRLFMSLFLGWLIKVMILRYGGGRLYRLAMPLFMGLIIGEIMANAVWILAPVIQLLMGVDPQNLDRLVIFQYT